MTKEAMRYIICDEIIVFMKELNSGSFVSVGTLGENILNACLQAGMKPPVEKFDPILLRTTHSWEE